MDDYADLVTSSQGEEETLLWLEPEWRATATAWIEREVSRAGFARDGDIDQPHVYWWSTALRVPTTGGTLWFKASQPDTFESRLAPLLTALAPENVAEVIATDVDRGWMLTRDAGVRLRDLTDGPALEHWEELLPIYADLQLQLVSRRADLLTMGAPDHRLDVLPEQLRHVLDEPETLMLEQPGRLTADERSRLLQGLPAFDELCMRLAGYGIPATLQHDDFNDGNVFRSDGRWVFFDWGDACLSHPFHTLVVTLRSLAYAYKLQPGGSEITRLRDAYLEPWTCLGSRAELTQAAQLARQTGTVQRSLAWARTARAMPPAVRKEYVDAVPYGLRLFLLNGPFGTWDDGSF